MSILDEIDRKIISRLVVDGRVTLKELSKETGYTVMGVKKRLDRLLGRDAIKVSANINVEMLGWIPLLVFIDVKDRGSMDSIMERFRECPRLILFLPALGGYNLIALMVAEDYRTLHCISSEGCSIKGLDGVIRVDYYPIGGVLYEPYLPVRLNLAYRGLEKPPCGVDCKLCRSYIDGRCVGCPATVHYRYRP
jgi:DNA-binding Lrp family transcriptional regulator